MKLNLTKSRYTVLLGFLVYFLLSSFIIRLILSILSIRKASFSATDILSIFVKGFVFDLGVAVFFSIVLSLYLLLLPQRWLKTRLNYVISYSLVFLMILITMFSFFAELTFWQEFESRFNFIAVDYLIYTFEVIHNINESYPLPILVSCMLLISFLVVFLMKKWKTFSISFNSQTPFKQRVSITAAIVFVAIFYAAGLPNNWAESGGNRYQNELSKSGIYSFFSAYKNNELNYEQFYALLDSKKAFKIIRNELAEPSAHFTGSPTSIIRQISNNGTEVHPNVIMITIESFSADFMKHFGNNQNLTPVLDSIANKSLLFTNMYATGTRTVRGLEALSLAVPPTPGNSIVRRPNNENLSTIGEIFRQKGYQTSFFYGGDGYFDNMNQYFSSNGFNVVDRGRKMTVGDHYSTKRTIISDNDVHFENAWGICDGDLYNAVIRDIDARYSNKKPFYDFVMTTSNHRPFTYPNGKIDITSGSGREGAVKYTDYAIGEFLKHIHSKPWFKNTVIIFVADHCASSAGKNEIDISKYHIPCMIYNLPHSKEESIDKMCSQIDLYPSLFHALNWKYRSNLYGKDVFNKEYTPRIVLGTYQKLAYMKKDSLVILSPQQHVETYIYKQQTNEQIPSKFKTGLCDNAIAYYQTAYSLFKNGALSRFKTY